MAAQDGNVRLIKMLIEGAESYKSDVALDKRDKRGRAPLHFAAANEHFHAVEMLCMAGASVDIEDNQGKLKKHIFQGSYV